MQVSTVLPSPKVTSLLARFDAWLEQRQRRAVEAWLATSQNVSDLESRMRDLNRGATHPYY